MAISHQAAGTLTIVSPVGPLVTGGPAEEYEQKVQELLGEGHRRIVTDLGRVPHLDSTGIRALVRGYTTAHRLGGRFQLVAPPPRVRQMLHITRLDTVFEIYDSLESVRTAAPEPS